MRLRLMRPEACEVASGVAASGDVQVVARASTDAAQLGLARRVFRRRFVHVCDGQRETGVAFNGRDNFAHHSSARGCRRRV